MTQHKEKILGVFFTYGVSLEVWKRQGMLQREITYYEKIAQKFSRVYFFTYGVENSELSAQLREKGIEVKGKKSWLPNFLYSFFLPFLYRSELRQCSVYKTNQMFGSWTAVIAKKLYKIPLLVRTGFTLSIFARQKNVFKLFVAKKVEAFALRSCDKLIVATASEKEYFSLYRDKVVVIPNFVDTEIFDFCPRTPSQTNEKTLLFVGRLSEQKNLENLFLALKDIPHISLQIIGSGKLQAHLAQLAVRNHLRVDFLGNKPYREIPSFIHKADLFVLPSLYEGNPKALLEAMACGAPIVATRVPGIENILTHTQTGYLCETDAPSLHDALKTVLADFPLQQKMAENAFHFIQKEYSLTAIVKKEESLYNELNIL